MSTLSEEVQRAMRRGFTLAAVSAGIACAPGVRDVDGGVLSRAPPEAFDCFPTSVTDPRPGGGTTSVQCCPELRCYTPDASACAPTLPSGPACECRPSMGPYAAPDGGASECCYVIATIGCVGRPLRERHEAIVADVVGREDWA